MLEKETTDTSEEEDLAQRKNYNELREDLLADEDEQDELGKLSMEEINEKLEERVELHAGFAFKKKKNELAFISSQAIDGLSHGEEYQQDTWDIIRKTGETQEHYDRFTKEEAYLVSGTSQNFIERSKVAVGKMRDTVNCKSETNVVN